MRCSCMQCDCLTILHDAGSSSSLHLGLLNYQPFVDNLDDLDGIPQLSSDDELVLPAEQPLPPEALPAKQRTGVTTRLARHRL
jgi:hypothetical protein